MLLYVGNPFHMSPQNYSNEYWKNTNLVQQLLFTARECSRSERAKEGQWEKVKMKEEDEYGGG